MVEIIILEFFILLKKEIKIIRLFKEIEIEVIV